ncbi:hypothetical protein C7B61_00300 [filamentous cyanobacterium CCP1]|nr:hypothetical protein C7B76_16760 [filamentous cyanobacterium CCP2]PSB68539.1 hypothetical protein C7B61_00300 [filamentous cyanobacterium CCP1]
MPKTLEKATEQQKLNRIEEIDRQITELTEAIGIVLNPPTLKIDESAYPALNEVRKFLAEAEQQGQASIARQQLESQIAELRAEKTRIEDEIETEKKNAEIDRLIALQPELLEKFKTAQAEADQALAALIKNAQELELVRSGGKFILSGVQCDQPSALKKSKIIAKFNQGKLWLSLDYPHSVFRDSAQGLRFKQYV